MDKQPAHKQQNAVLNMPCSEGISVCVRQAGSHFGKHTKERKGARFTLSRTQVKHKAWNTTSKCINQSIKHNSDDTAHRMQEEMTICHNYKKNCLSSNM